MTDQTTSPGLIDLATDEQKATLGGAQFGDGSSFMSINDDETFISDDKDDDRRSKWERRLCSMEEGETCGI